MVQNLREQKKSVCQLRIFPALSWSGNPLAYPNELYRIHPSITKYKKKIKRAEHAWIVPNPLLIPGKTQHPENTKNNSREASTLELFRVRYCETGMRTSRALMGRGGDFVAYNINSPRWKTTNWEPPERLECIKIGFSRKRRNQNFENYFVVTKNITP